MNFQLDHMQRFTRSMICHLMLAGVCTAANAETAVPPAVVPPAALAKAPDCVAQTQLDVGKIQTQIILIGEVHGTQEIPAFTSGLVCSLLKNGRSVILAIEHFAEGHENLQRYIESKGTQADRATLIGAHQWASVWQDGRSSAAMFALVEDLRRLRQSGQRVGILAMQKLDSLKVPMTEAERAHLTPADNSIYNDINDRAMADSILSAAVLYRRYTVLALAGYGHTSTQRGRGGDPDLVPMAKVLSAMAPTFIIGVRQGGGEHWALGSRYAVDPIEPGDLFDKEARVDAIVTIPQITPSPSANPVAGAAAQKR